MLFVNDPGEKAIDGNRTSLSVAVVLAFSVCTFGFAALAIAVPIAGLIGLFWLILAIVAAISAKERQYDRYPPR